MKIFGLRAGEEFGILCHNIFLRQLQPGEAVEGRRGGGGRGIRARPRITGNSTTVVIARARDKEA